MSDKKIIYTYQDNVECPIDGCIKSDSVRYSNNSVDIEPDDYQESDFLICPKHNKKLKFKERIKLTIIEEIIKK